MLRSWAVPRGPSYNTADKRLAVHVEDHPLEYGDFEGLIPEGNYGAGAVIVWDRGQWLPTGDPAEGLEKGKLLFELRGHKLHGMWTLVKLKKGEKEWLLIKERDGYASSDGEAPAEESVLSGLTVEDLKAGRTPEAGLLVDLDRLGAPKRAVQPESVQLMLAETREQAFTAPGWYFELKLDGYRVLAARDGTSRLLSRNGNDLSASFPEVVQALSALPFKRLLFDGEVVALDEAGRPSFQRLQQRARLRRGARRPPCDGREPGHLLRIRSPCRRRLRSASTPTVRPKATASETAASSRCPPLSRSLRERGRGAVPAGAEAGPGRDRGQASGVSLSPRALGGLAQDPNPPDR